MNSIDEEKKLAEQGQGHGMAQATQTPEQRAEPPTGAKPQQAQGQASSETGGNAGFSSTNTIEQPTGDTLNGRPVERAKAPGRVGARGTAAMDPETRQEVARKGGLAVSRNKQHMAEIGRKGGQSVSKNREHMAKIGRKGGAASRGHS